jgi:hypothetical protein
MAKRIRNKFRFLTNNEEQLIKIHDYFSDFSFNKINPLPVVDDEFRKTSEYDNIVLELWGTREEPVVCQWVNEIDFVFDTITTPPLPIVEKILKHFQNIDIDYYFSSEDVGKIAGSIKQFNGEINANLCDDYSKESYEIAFTLRPYTVYEHVFDDKKQTYEYSIEDIVKYLTKNGVYSEDKDTKLVYTVKKI